MKEGQFQSSETSRSKKMPACSLGSVVVADGHQVVEVSIIGAEVQLKDLLKDRPQTN